MAGQTFFEKWCIAVKIQITGINFFLTPYNRIVYAGANMICGL